MSSNETLDRREFLRSVARAAVGGAVLASGAGAGEDKTATPGPGYRRLGRTGLDVSVVSFGGHAAFRGYVIAEAVDNGVNLIHTAPFYARGMGMRVFGQVLRTLRDKVHLAVKVFPDASVVDRCLQVLRTDHIDLVMPGLQSVGQLKRPGLVEDFQKLKQQGKARFLGMACHSNIPAVVAEALKMDCFDVVMLCYNLANRKDLGPLLAEAKTRGVGVIGMKSLRGIQGEQDGEPTIEARAETIRELLREPRVATVLKRMASQEEVAAYTGIMRSELGRGSRKARGFEELVRRSVCGSCGACSVCPQGVRISDILRYAMYAADSDPVHRAYGPDAYRRLGPKRSFESCNGCGECERACPKGLDIRAQLAQAHAILA